MNFNVVTIIIIIGNTLANDLSKPGNIFADNLLHKLKQENWNEEEQPCWESMSRLLEGANNNIIWSTWVLDSMQLPVGALYGSRYHLGNFDQCLDNTWSSSHPELETQYCLVNLIAEEVAAAQFSPYDDVEALIKSKSKHGKRRFINSFGVCVPSSCSPRSVEKISKHIISSNHLRYGDVTVDSRNCQTLKQTMEYSTGFYVFWFIIISLTFILVVVYLFEGDLKDSNWSALVFLFSPSKNLKTLTNINSDEVSLHFKKRSEFH